MKRIGWFEPRFGEEEIAEARKVLENNYLNEGLKSKELEENLRDILGVKYILLTTNATAALFLSIKSESILRGVENDFDIIVPDLTMIASATSVIWAGGNPIIVDVKKDDGTIDTEKIVKKITKKTIGILPVHVLGRSAEMKRLKEIAEKFNLVIIEDAAGALGSMNDGKYLGTIGDYGCFSLQSNKIISCGQGGIIATNDQKRYDILKRLRDFGRLNNQEFLHDAIGFNLKFNDLSAAVALAQLKKLEERKIMLTNQFNLYKNNLKEQSEVCFFNLRINEIPLWVDIIAKDADKLNSFLLENNIICRKCWPSIHMNKPFNKHGEEKDFPVSSFISKNTLWLPNGPSVSEEDINFVCEKIREFYKNDKL
jgi:perosamine synthetase